MPSTLWFVFNLVTLLHKEQQVSDEEYFKLVVICFQFSNFAP